MGACGNHLSLCRAPSRCVCCIFFCIRRLGAYAVDAQLADIYGVEAPPQGFERVDTGGRRPGLLGHAGVLAAHSLPDGTSPPRRGKLIAERFACFGIPEPPDNIEVSEDVRQRVTTTRGYFEALTGPGTCGAGCPVLLTPPGFAFEHFDQVGRWRDAEGDIPVDSAVDLGPLGLGAVTGAAELGRDLGSADNVLDCFTKEYYRYVMGRIERGDDRALVRDVSAAFREARGDLRALLTDMLAREAMYTRQMPCSPHALVT